MSYYVYILYSAQINKYYIGQTNDLRIRVKQHLTKYYPLSYTTVANDWDLFIDIKCASKSQAIRIEQHIKRMKSQQYIENLKKYPEILEKLKTKYQ